MTAKKKRKLEILVLIQQGIFNGLFYAYSTLYVTSTISVPNNDETILSVSTVLHCQMLQVYYSFNNLAA